MSSSNQNNSSMNNSNQPSKKGKGRQKIDMVKIENETNLQVTFSKRRAGVFKKASELSTLCGAESAIVVFSPGDKAHSFGNPNVQTITDRFLNNNNNNNNNVTATNEASQQRRTYGDAATRQRNQELSQLEDQLKKEKERRKYNENLRKAPQSQAWSPPNLDDLNYQQLDELKRSILSFKHNLETKMQDATSLVNSHSQGSNQTSRPGLPWRSSVGPSRHDHFRNKPPLTLGGSSSNAGALTLGGSSSNAGVNATTFPGYAPYNYYQTSIGNSDGMTMQYPDYMGSSSYSYGNPAGSTKIIPYGYGEGSSAMGVEPEERSSRGTQASSDQDMYPGFTNNDVYGRGK